MRRRGVKVYATYQRSKMCGRALRKSAQVCVLFYLVTFCASTKRGNGHGILSHRPHNNHARKHTPAMEGRNAIMRPYRHKHQTAKENLNKYSSMKSSERQAVLSDKRDFVPKQYTDLSFSKSNIFEENFETQGLSQFGEEGQGMAHSMGSIDSDDTNSVKARKVVSQNELGDLKSVEDADKSVNEVINSILDEDKNLEKAVSDEKDYSKPSYTDHSEGNEDYDVKIDESSGDNQEGNSYLHTKITPGIVKETLYKEVTQAGRINQPFHSSDGKSNETGLPHSWSLHLDSSNDYSDYSSNGSQGNISGSHGNGEYAKPLNDEAGDSSAMSNQNANHSMLFDNEGTVKNATDSNAYNKFGNGAVESFNPTLNANGSILFDGGNNQVKNISATFTSDASLTKMLNNNNDTNVYINPNSTLADNTKLGNDGDEILNNSSSQNVSNEIELPRAKDVSNINNGTSELNGLQVEKDSTNVENESAVLGNGPEEYNAKNPSGTQSQTIKNNSTSFENESKLYSGNYRNITPIDNIRNNGTMNVNADATEGSRDAHNAHSEHNANDNNSMIGNMQPGNTTAPSNFLKQHPNAFKILMEYFRNETSLQQKLRNRLNALRKTKIDQNPRKKSFASVHELEAVPKRPLPLREFVADFLKFATEHVPPNLKPRNALKAKTSEQGFGNNKVKSTEERKYGPKLFKPLVGAPLEVSGRHYSIQAPKQHQSSRKADISFLANFENVTEVAKEINGNITKIFEEAMGSNSHATKESSDVTVEPIASSAFGVAEEKIGQIISENEIPQNELSYVKGNAISKEGTTSIGSNAISNGATGPTESEAISVEAKRPVANPATKPLGNNTISIGETTSKERNSTASIGQPNPSVAALNDFIHPMDSKTMMYKKELKSLEVSLSQDFFDFWMYHYRSFEEMSIKPEQLRSGIANLGSTDRLERVIKKSLKGETVNLLIVGGSISAGGGLERDRHDLHGIYYKAFVEWWRNTVTPITSSDLKLNVVAIGGTDSEYFAYCIKNYIHEQPDLVIWELAANDYRRYVGRGMDPAKPLEQLTRVLLTLPSHPALIFINFFRGDYYKTTLGQDCPDSEDEGGSLIAEYYKITSLTWRNVICSQMKPDIPGPGDGAKREYTPLTLKTLFSSDGYHPSLLGHAQCATLLTSYIRSVFEEVVSREISRLDEGKADDDNRTPRKSDLPRPLYNDPVVPNPVCWTLLTPNFHREIENQLPRMRIVEANGFEFTNITHWSVRMDRLRCLKARNTGASLRIKFDVLRREDETSSAQRDIAIISHNSFSGSATVWLDNDQSNSLVIEEPIGQRRTQATIIKRVLAPGSHVITIRSITPGFCVSALAVL